MRIFAMHREQNLPMTISEAWSFFSSPKNLEKITPPEMKFQITSHLGNEPIFSGMQIEYIIRPILGIPLRWVTVIKNVQEPSSFTDMQQSGPYALWEHTHSFQSIAGGVKMTDDIKYSLPFGWIGSIAHWLFVSKQLETIFDFRADVLKKLFSQKKEDSYVGS